MEVSKELKIDENMQMMLGNKLFSMSHRTYLWLYFVIEEVRSSLSRNLKGISDVVGSIPKTVHDAHELLLRTNTKKRRDRRDALKLLHINVGTRRALLLKELDVAFQIASEDSVSSYSDVHLDTGHLARRIRNLYGLFVFIKDARVYLIHLTAKEFLVSNNSVTETEDRLKYSLREADSGMAMANVCVRYLLFTDALRETALCENEQYPPWENPESDLMDYSTSNWVFHIQDAKPGENDPSQQEVLRLCEADARGVEICCFDDSGRQYLSKMRRIGKILFFATHFGLDMMIQLLLQSDKVGINSPDDFFRQAPLYLAAECGHENAVKLLLQSSTTDVNLQDAQKRTPLHRATGCGYKEVVKLLLDMEKVKVNSQTIR